MYRKAVAARPGDPLAHFGLGSALSASDSPRDARREFQEALRLNPELTEARVEWAHTLTRLGRPRDGERELRKVLARRSVRRAHLLLGWALFQQARYREAETEYRVEAAQYPGGADPHVYLGVLYVTVGRFEEAKTELEVAMRWGASDYITHYYLAAALDGSGRIDEAIAEYRKAISIDPKQPEAHLKLGTALTTRAEWEEAFEEIRTAIRLDPGNPSARRHLAYLLAHVRNYPEAWRQVHEAQKRGFVFDDNFLRFLRAKMPEPRE